MVHVNYDDAVAYAKWLTEKDRASGKLPAGYSYRLPTGDEWMTFAQCGDGRVYPWGDDWPPRSGQAGNYCGQETKALAGSRIPGYSDASIVTCDVEDSWKNPWGLYGVGGNVWECTSKAPGGAVDAWRGAAWGGNPQDFLRCSFRDACYASGRTYATGFRLLLNRQPVPKGETASG